MMNRQISDESMHEAYVRGNLGAQESYAVWSPLWAVRSKIWRTKKDRKVARNALGQAVLEAVDLADVEELENLSAALKDMLVAERTQAFAEMADVFFAVEQLNMLAGEFTKVDLLKWLNKEMDAAMTAADVERVLYSLGLADLIPVGKKVK